MPDESLLKRYAELVVRVGANVNEGQDVAISAYVEQAPFARALATAAYEAGAHYVTAQYHDQFIKRELIIHGDDDILEWSPPWDFERLEHLSRVGGANIFIAGDPNPDVFEDLDGVRVGKARPKALSERALQITFEEKTINWTIAAYPSERWAEKAYGNGDLERLWQDVAKAVRLDQPDPVDAWQEHVKRLRRAPLLRPGHGSDDRPDAGVQLGRRNPRDRRRDRARAEHADRGSVHRARRATYGGDGAVDASSRDLWWRDRRGLAAALRGRTRRRSEG
jgi:aminopeptidase